MAWEAKGCEIYDGDTLIAVFKGPYEKACRNARIAAIAPQMIDVFNGIIRETLSLAEQINADGE